MLKCDSCHGSFHAEQLVFVKIDRPQSLNLTAALCHDCDDRLVLYLRFMHGFDLVFDKSGVDDAL